MSKRDGKRYYWLQLEKDFFKRHDIRIIESMQNGKDYILFYLKLICESTSHEGRLRFSDTIPYNDEMLATITNTNVDIVRAAMAVFMELDMIHVLSDETIYMTMVEKMIGSETHQTRRKRDSKENKDVETSTFLDGGGKSYPKRTPEIELEIELDIKEKEKKEKAKRTQKVPPSMEDVKKYHDERVANGKPDVDIETWFNFYESKNWMVGKNKMVNWQAAYRTWEQRERQNKKRYVSGLEIAAELEAQHEHQRDWSNVRGSEGLLPEHLRMDADREDCDNHQRVGEGSSGLPGEHS